MNQTALRLAARLFDVPVIQNQYRSAFVEEMLGPQLDARGWTYAGDNWAGWDFEHTDGAKLEIKQSAALQTWSDKLGIRTAGSFDIAPRKGYFDRHTGLWVERAGRLADIYAFAWHGVSDAAADHRDPSQWVFYVVQNRALPTQKRISLKAVSILSTHCTFDTLADEVSRVRCNLRS